MLESGTLYLKAYVKATILLFSIKSLYEHGTATLHFWPSP